MLEHTVVLVRSPVGMRDALPDYRVGRVVHLAAQMVDGSDTHNPEPAAHPHNPGTLVAGNSGHVECSPDFVPDIRLVLAVPNRGSIMNVRVLDGKGEERTHVRLCS